MQCLARRVAKNPAQMIRCRMYGVRDGLYGYVVSYGAMQLRAYNFVAPLEDAGVPVTTKPDAPVAPK